MSNSFSKPGRIYRAMVFTSILALGLSFFSCNSQRSANDKTPYLVVLSMDGFRWDYADMAETPNLDKIAAHGVKAEKMIPSFPTKTFPNHYTMATGLYPDHHGIVLNTFYDPDENRSYTTRNRDAVGDGSFYGGEPIWVTAESQDVRSASLFWVGSEADIQGTRPSYWKKYQHHMPYEDRIDTVISWLQKPEDLRPHLIMWYFDEPDGCGHNFGPESHEIVQTVQHLDSLLGVFLNKLEQLPIGDQVNFIVTSDHGMGPTSADKLVLLSDYIDTNWVAEARGNNPVYTLMAAEGHKEELQNALAQIKNIHFWPSSEVPERLHYGTNPRTLDFVVVADSSWSINYDKPDGYFGGTHGYDNANTDMHTIFYAMGPAFKNRGYIHPAFANVCLYPLMCEILDVVPAPNDGSLEKVNGLLK